MSIHFTGFRKIEILAEIEAIGKKYELLKEADETRKHEGIVDWVKDKYTGYLDLPDLYKKAQETAQTFVNLESKIKPKCAYVVFRSMKGRE